MSSTYFDTSSVKALFIIFSIFFAHVGACNASTKPMYKAGHASLQEWLMPNMTYPKENGPTPERVALGKKLFFDPRISADGNISCATCHSPLLGWSDGLPTAKGFKSQLLHRASPTIINTGFQKIQMWDGRAKTLEDQALGPLASSNEMNMGIEEAVKVIAANQEYKKLFETAYPGLGVTDKTLAMAIASFERTIISNNSRFDKWIKGDKNALSKKEIEGFKIFNDKGNCDICHSAPNFTDDGFHNIGLTSYDAEDPDMGRYAIKPIRILKGAFKTPTLREVVHTAPYFHDGSVATLEEVVEHYNVGGVSKKDLSPNMKPLGLSKDEKEKLVSFLKSLSTQEKPFTLPIIPN